MVRETSIGCMTRSSFVNLTAEVGKTGASVTESQFTYKAQIAETLNRRQVEGETGIGDLRFGVNGD